MSVIQVTFPPAGLVGVNPPIYYIQTNDSLSTITTAGYLMPNSENAYGGQFQSPGLCCVQNTTDGVTWLNLSIASSGVITLSEQVIPGNVLLPVTSGDFAVFNGTTGQIKDAGYLPSNAAKTVVSMVSSSVPVSHIASFTDTSGTMGDSGLLTSVVVQNNSSNSFGALGSIILNKVNGTEASNAVTASGVAGVITTSALTTASGSNYAITWTNTSISATSVVVPTWEGGTNTTANFKIKVAPGSESATLTIYNTDPSAALNGTILIGYLVF